MNLPIGLSLSDKFKLLRKNENLTQRGLAGKLQTAKTTLANIENEKTKSISSELLTSFINDENLRKYALWLLIDDMTEEQAADIVGFLERTRQPEE